MSKKPKMVKARPSRSRRKLKGSHELKVSSEITLKELKVMVSVLLIYLAIMSNSIFNYLAKQNIMIYRETH